jgi:methylmalonyl-CoA mutase cobalamin-binding subunit
MSWAGLADDLAEEEDKMGKRVLLFISLISFWCFSSAAGSFAAGIPDVFFILDASGSMGAKMGDSTKMKVAKEVLDYTVQALPAEVKVGLALYGNHRKGDCSDIEILSIPGEVDRQTILAKVKEVTPVGMTPIAASVEMVAKTIKDADTIIVLVSDGEETCSKDPCGVVKALKASSAKLILHVVGFGVTQAEEKQLRCLAEAGGGSYFAAGDAKGLLASLESVRKDVEQKVEQAKTTKVKARSGLGKLSVVIPKSAVPSLSKIKIIRASDNSVVKEAEEIQGPHPLPAGNYRLVLGFANPNYVPPTDAEVGEVEIRGGETSEISMGAVLINLAPGLAKAANMVCLTDEKSGKDYLKVNAHGNDYYLMKPKAAPEGTYILSFAYARNEKTYPVSRGIEVKKGRETVVTLDSGISIKKSAAGIVGWDVVPTGSKEPVLEVRRRWDNDYPLWESFPLPPGRYDILIHIKGMKEPLLAGEAVEVKKGETVVFDAGL